MKTPAQYCVYVSYFPSLGILKVGRTSDIDRRKKGLKSGMKGETVVVCAEFFMGSCADAITMERDAIEMLASRGYERQGREWFHVRMDEMPALVDAVGRSTSVNILGRYRLGDKPKARTRFAYEMAATSKSLYGHNSQAQSLSKII